VSIVGCRRMRRIEGGGYFYLLRCLRIYIDFLYVIVEETAFIFLIEVLFTFVPYLIFLELLEPFYRE